MSTASNALAVPYFHRVVNLAGKIFASLYHDHFRGNRLWELWIHVHLPTSRGCSMQSIQPRSAQPHLCGCWGPCGGHTVVLPVSRGGPALVLTNSSQVTITRSEFDGDYSEIMIVEGLTAANEGFYKCQGLVWHQDQILRLSPSAMFELRPIDRYFPINCPNKALKSHAVRCARVIQLPMVSSSALPSSRQSSTFEVLLTSGESLRIPRAPWQATHSPSPPQGCPLQDRFQPSSQP